MILSTLKVVAIDRPLTFYGIPGVILLVIGLVFVGWAIQGYVEHKSIITNISLIAIGSTIFGTLLSMTAVLLYSLVNVVRERR